MDSSSVCLSVIRGEVNVGDDDDDDDRVRFPTVHHIFFMRSVAKKFGNSTETLNLAEGEF